MIIRTTNNEARATDNKAIRKEVDLTTEVTRTKKRNY